MGNNRKKNIWNNKEKERKKKNENNRQIGTKQGEKPKFNFRCKFFDSLFTFDSQKEEDHKTKCKKNKKKKADQATKLAIAHNAHNAFVNG